jgi:hypothetical protein
MLSTRVPTGVDRKTAQFAQNQFQKKKVRTKQAGPSRPELAAVQQNELGSVQWSSRPSQARGEPKKTWYVQP